MSSSFPLGHLYDEREAAGSTVIAIGQWRRGLMWSVVEDVLSEIGRQPGGTHTCRPELAPASVLRGLNERLHHVDAV